MNKQTYAFSEALALESIPNELCNIPRSLLVDYAEIVAYKVFHNLANGYEMNPADDPLYVDNDRANEVWAHHYARYKV